MMLKMEIVFSTSDGVKNLKLYSFGLVKSFQLILRFVLNNSCDEQSYNL